MTEERALRKLRSGDEAGIAWIMDHYSRLLWKVAEGVLSGMDEEGHLTPREKIRSKKKVMRRCIEKMLEHADGGADYSGKCFMCHSLCIDDAKELASMIEATFPKLNGPVQIWPIGAVIGSHTGPGTISIFFWGDSRH